MNTTTTTTTTTIKAGDKVRGLRAGRFIVVEVFDFHGVASVRLREDSSSARSTIVLPIDSVIAA